MTLTRHTRPLAAQLKLLIPLNKSTLDWTSAGDEVLYRQPMPIGFAQTAMVLLRRIARRGRKRMERFKPGDRYLPSPTVEEYEQRREESNRLHAPGYHFDAFGFYVGPTT